MKLAATIPIARPVMLTKVKSFWFLKLRSVYCNFCKIMFLIFWINIYVLKTCQSSICLIYRILKISISFECKFILLFCVNLFDIYIPFEICAPPTVFVVYFVLSFKANGCDYKYNQ